MYRSVEGVLQCFIVSLWTCCLIVLVTLLRMVVALAVYTAAAILVLPILWITIVLLWLLFTEAWRRVVLSGLDLVSVPGTFCPAVRCTNNLRKRDSLRGLFTEVWRRVVLLGLDLVSDPGTFRPAVRCTNNLRKRDSLRGGGGAHPADSDEENDGVSPCLLYTSPSPRDLSTSRMPSSA